MFLIVDQPRNLCVTGLAPPVVQETTALVGPEAGWPLPPRKDVARNSGPVDLGMIILTSLPTLLLSLDISA